MGNRVFWKSWTRIKIVVGGNGAIVLKYIPGVELLKYTYTGLWEIKSFAMIELCWYLVTMERLS